jgi:transposase
MTAKTKPMSQIKQLLQLHKQGQKIRFISRSLSLSRNTVRSYLLKAAALPIGVDSLLELSDPALEAMFHAGNPAYKDNERRYDYFKTRLDYFLREQKKTGVTRRLLWQEYLSDQPQGYRYTQFCYHLDQHSKAGKPSMVLTHTPGEKLFVDFAGKKLSYVDMNTGEIIDCQIFVACLPYSDYSFALGVPSQCVVDFLYALACCLQHIGGVPQMIVSDNLKSAVIKANRYEPDLNRSMEDFANHYGCSVVPTRAIHPKDKALVENQVKLVYQRVYAKLRHSTFTSLSALNEGIKEKILLHNQTRMQQKPYCREERFLSNERHLLSALPTQEFEIKHYKEYKVAKNNHIFLTQDKHYYSVPYAWIGTQVKVIYTRTMVRIYAQGNQIAVHPRDTSMGRYSSDKEHLCSAHNHYNDRSPRYYIDKATQRSTLFGRFITLLFKQDKHPEQLYRSCDGLLSLCAKSELEDFEKACQIAIDNHNFSYMFVRNIIENKMTRQLNQDTLFNKKSLPTHENIRGKAYYNQTMNNQTSNNQTILNFNNNESN